MTRRFVLLICFALSLAAIACEKENSGGAAPSREGTAQTQPPAEPQPAADAQPAPPITIDPTAPAPNPERKPITYPDFFDTNKGEVKDVPMYPNAQISNMRLGPPGSVESVIIFAGVYGSFDEAVDFYDKAIKKNRWNVYSNTREPGDVMWKMTKGSRDEAVVQLKVDKSSGGTQLAITRFRKPVADVEQR